MEDTKTTQATFRRLGELGTHLSIDDFGTGYSSLSYLRRLPAEELKIDRSFIMDLEHSADARAVVDAVIKLAHALGLKVVAEGVENPRQQQVLVEMQLRRAAGLPVRQADVGAGAAALGDERPRRRGGVQAFAVRRDAAVRTRLSATAACRASATACAALQQVHPGRIRASSQAPCGGRRGCLQCLLDAPPGALTRETIMSEHTLSAVLTFALLAGGAAAIGSEMFAPRQVPAPQPIAAGGDAADRDGHRPAAPGREGRRRHGRGTGRRARSDAEATAAPLARRLTSAERRAGSCG